jgi:hypothetical protein
LTTEESHLQSGSEEEKKNQLKQQMQAESYKESKIKEYH